MYGASNDAVDGWLSERIELSVFAAHEIWFDDIATAAVVFERTKVELHRQI